MFVGGAVLCKRYVSDLRQCCPAGYLFGLFNGWVLPHGEAIVPRFDIGMAVAKPWKSTVRLENP